jgi:hypothetical protein
MKPITTPVPPDVTLPGECLAGGSADTFLHNGTLYITQLVKIEKLPAWRQRHHLQPVPKDRRPRTGLTMWPPATFYEPIEPVPVGATPRGRPPIPAQGAQP